MHFGAVSALEVSNDNVTDKWHKCIAEASANNLNTALVQIAAL